MHRYKLEIRCEDGEGGSWEPPDVEISADNMEAAEQEAIEQAFMEMQPFADGLQASEVRVSIEPLTEDDVPMREVEVRGTEANPDITIW